MCRQVYCKTALLILQSVGVLSVGSMLVYCRLFRPLCLYLTFCVYDRCGFRSAFLSSLVKPIKGCKHLKTNRRILKKHNKSGYTTLQKSLLLAEGFNPRYFTHYWKTKKGEVYLFCYDYGFLSLEKEGKSKYLIVQWQAYME